MAGRNGKEVAQSLVLCLVVLVGGCSSQDGSYQVPPWPPATVDLWPKWCPADSAKIAYTHFAETLEEVQEFGETSFWIVDIVTGEKQYVSEGTACDWSPDGNYIVFAWGGLWLIDLATGEKRSLTCEDLTCHHVMADFSPCGTKIAYVQDAEPQRGIWILDLTTTSKKWISSHYTPDWHPDGNEILCDSLVVIREDGTRVRKIPYDPELGYPGHGRWSPDGTRIAFGGGYGDGEHGIWLINADGTDLRFLCHGSTPSWSPDGSMIAYTDLSVDESGSAIWIVNTDGAWKRQITFPGSSE